MRLWVISCTWSELLFQEFPFVRYPAAKGLDGSSDMSFRDLVPTKLAAAIWNSIDTYKTSIPNFPQTETCELLIVDRSVDKVLHNTLIVLLNVFYFFFFFFFFFVCSRMCMTWTIIFFRLLLLFMNGPMMLCVMTYLEWMEINICMRYRS